MSAGGDPTIGRVKSFLLVGIAYFLVAILGPIIIMLAKGANWSFSPKGSFWSLTAGIVGALGALFVLLAFGAKESPTFGKGNPAVVMTIIFASAPIVNALVLTAMNNLWSGIRWQFTVGILLAAIGGGLVTLYKPVGKGHGAPAKKPAAAAEPATALMDYSKYRIS